MQLISKIIQIYQDKAKRETLVLLRAMSDRQLRDSGISPELLNDGVKAWPWREIPDNNYVPLKFAQIGIENSVLTGVSQNEKTNREENELIRDNAA